MTHSLSANSLAALRSALAGGLPTERAAHLFGLTAEQVRRLAGTPRVRMGALRTTARALNTADELRREMARDTLEAKWQADVIDLAASLGWVHQHQTISLRSVPGWPDLVLCRPPRLVVAELKSERGTVKREQRAWLNRLAACNVECYVWKPSDRLEVQEILRLPLRPSDGFATAWKEGL